jgi:hypothetical protein
MRAMRALIVIAAMIGVSPALADTVTCSMWQQITTCVRPDGYVSHEITWKGITTGSHNRGNRWSSSRWQSFETLTDKPRQER